MDENFKNVASSDNFVWWSVGGLIHTLFSQNTAFSDSINIKKSDQLCHLKHIQKLIYVYINTFKTNPSMNICEVDFWAKSTTEASPREVYMQ